MAPAGSSVCVCLTALPPESVGSPRTWQHAMRDRSPASAG